MRSLVLGLLAAAAFAQSGDPALDAYLTRLANEALAARRAAISKIRTPEDVRARQRYIRERMTAEIGGFPEKTPLHARVTGTLIRDGYRVEKVIYESMPGFRVSANAYVPTNAKPPFAAVIGVAGHTNEGKAAAIYQHAWIGMVKRGFLVLAIDPPGQGERIAMMGGTLEHSLMGTQCLLTGTNIARYEVFDGMRGVDYLLERGDVDPQRLAVAGNSGGGTQSAYLAVFEPRLAVAAPSCYITSWEELWKGQGPQDAEQDFDRFLADGFDFPDFLIAFAPRPIHMATAIQDFFPIAGARATYAETQRIFGVMDASVKAGYFEFDDGHGWSLPRRQATYRWLEKWLHGRDDAGTEPQIVPEAEQALWTTATGRVGGETVQSLNRKFAESLRPTGKPTVQQIREVLRVPRGDGEPAPRVEGSGSGTVLAVGDAPGDAAMRVTPRGWAIPQKQAFSVSMRAAMVGRTLLGLQVHDVLAALEQLRARPGMGDAVITLRGRGNGATVALFAAVLAKGPVKVEEIEGVLSYRSLVEVRYPAGVETLIVPGILKHFDLPDVRAMLR